MPNYYRIPRFNSNCDACSLKCGKAVPGQSEVPFNEVALVVVSAYPGNQEIQQGLSLAPAPKEKTTKGREVKKEMGAGEFLRISLNSLFDKDPNIPDAVKPFEKYVYYTNQVKCTPQRGRDTLTVTDTIIRTCGDQWLKKELLLLPPQVPILIAASHAVKGLLGKNPETKKWHSLYDSRRKIHRVGNHPAVVTFNPIEVERGLIKDIKDPGKVEEDLKKLFLLAPNPGKKIGKMVQGYYWKPTPIGSMPWHWKKDMELVKELVVQYLSSKA